MNDTGEPFILIAMKRVLERGKANWGYVKGILKAWMKKGIVSVDDAVGKKRYFVTVRKSGLWCEASSGGCAGLV